MVTEQRVEQPDVLEIAARAKKAAAALARVGDQLRKQALLKAADNIQAAREDIIRANQQDLAAAEKRAASGELSSALIARLKIDDTKLSSIVEGMRQVADLPDLLWQRQLATELDSGLTLERITCPIGVIAVIFEARPDALPQIASLCIKSGNAVILKGGREALHSNRALFTCIEEACRTSGLPDGTVALVESREAVQQLLDADRFVDLIVPRGSNELVRNIQQNTRIPVLGHADGLCHLYVDEDADVEKAARILVDSKVQYPAACNSVETVLVHRNIARAFMSLVVPQLLQRAVEIRVDSELQKCVPHDVRQQLSPATEADWRTEYCDLVVSMKMVDDLSQAICHINDYGSHHTDAIVTENETKFDDFFAQVNSAGVYWNCSTRFADGFRYGFGAEVGISTGKLHPRGPVGVEGLVTYKYRLVGDGHIVADYSGSNARKFTHRKLND